jgi:hypothetical protein
MSCRTGVPISPTRSTWQIPDILQLPLIHGGELSLHAAFPAIHVLISVFAAAR